MMQTATKKPGPAEGVTIAKDDPVAGELYDIIMALPMDVAGVERDSVTGLRLWPLQTLTLYGYVARRCTTRKSVDETMLMLYGNQILRLADWVVLCGQVPMVALSGELQWKVGPLARLWPDASLQHRVDVGRRMDPINPLCERTYHAAMTAEGVGEP